MLSLSPRSITKTLLEQILLDVGCFTSGVDGDSLIQPSTNCLATERPKGQQQLSTLVHFDRNLFHLSASGQREAGSSVIRRKHSFWALSDVTGSDLTSGKTNPQVAAPRSWGEEGLCSRMGFCFVLYTARSSTFWADRAAQIK